MARRVRRLLQFLPRAQRVDSLVAALGSSLETERSSIARKPNGEPDWTILESDLQEGMDKLGKAVNRSAVTDFGKFTSTGFGVDALSNRLRMVDYFKKHLRLPMAECRPVFIVGFPERAPRCFEFNA